MVPLKEASVEASSRGRLLSVPRLDNTSPVRHEDAALCHGLSLPAKLQCGT